MAYLINKSSQTQTVIDSFVVQTVKKRGLFLNGF